MVHKLLQPIGTYLIVFETVGGWLPLEVEQGVVAWRLLPERVIRHIEVGNAQVHDFLDYPVVVTLSDDEFQGLRLLCKVLCG